VPSWPWTFATLPAGNVAASKLDDNFSAAMFAAGSSTNGQVPTWNGTSGNVLNTTGYTVGTAANNLVQLDGSGLLPASVTSGLAVATAYLSFLGPSTIAYSKNIASCVRTSTGQYLVTFTSGPGSSNFVSVVGSAFGGPGLMAQITARTSTTVSVGTSNSVSQTYQDAGGFELVCFW
jgi:hypothetical protein